MKVYVATKAENWPAAREVMQRVRTEGHTVTYDWTKDVEASGPMGTEGNQLTDDQLAELAMKDLCGAVDCDVLLQLPYDGLCGTLIETGAALSAGKRVWILGEPAQLTVFYTLPTVAVMSLDVLEEALAILDVTESCGRTNCEGCRELLLSLRALDRPGLTTVSRKSNNELPDRANG